MKREVTTRIETRLWELVRGTARAHNISLETFTQMSLVLGLEHFGLKVSPEWLRDNGSPHRSLRPMEKA